MPDRTACAEQPYDLIIVGAGSAGLTAAELAAKTGARVALVDKSKRRMGGECLHTGCVPSKSLIYAAREPNATWATAGRHVAATIKHIQTSHDNPEFYQSLGVDTYFGAVTLRQDRCLRVGTRVLHYKKLLLATGSKPRIPVISGLEETGYETNETIFRLKNAPKSLAIIGGGPIAIELAFALLRLGTRVHIIEHNPQILSVIDPDAAELVRGSLLSMGARLYPSASIISVARKGKAKEIVMRHGEKNEALRAEMILVAAGRSANVPAGAAAIGVQHEKGAITVDERWRTGAPHVYAAGDCTDFGRNFTHTAASAAAEAVSHALYGVSRRRDLKRFVYVFFTEPEVAQVGATTTDLEEAGIGHTVYQLPFEDVDKALTDRSDGFMKVCVDYAGRILGATVVGESAGELIGYFGIAMEKHMKVAELAAMPLPYPTLSFGVKQLAFHIQLEAIEKKRDILSVLRRLRR